VLDEIEMKVDQLHGASESVIDNMKFDITAARKNIFKYKQHIVRAKNQDKSRTNVLNALEPEKEVLLHMDFAMKFIPTKFRESQSEWFAKRGISWHIIVAFQQNVEKKFETVTFVHVLDSADQNSDTVLALLSDTIQRLKVII
jgi:hypothetical protein